MGAAKKDIEIEQGSKFNPVYQWLDENDNPIDISGWSGRMEIREQKDKSSALIFRAATDNGRMIINGTVGEVRPTITASETDGFDFKWAWYDIEIIPPSGEANAERLAQGKVRLDKSVTDT